MQTMIKPWTCDACGETTDLESCPKCYRTRPIQAPEMRYGSGGRPYVIDYNTLYAGPVAYAWIALLAIILVFSIIYLY